VERAPDDQLLESKLAWLLQGQGLPRALWFRCLVATAFFVVALLVRLTAPLAEFDSTLFTFFPAVVAAAFLGWGPALLAIVLSVLASPFVLMTPSRPLASDMEALPSLVSFVLVGLAICGIVDLARRALRALRAAQDITSAELRHARSDLQAILDNLPARVTCWNLDGTNSYANAIAERDFGFAPGGMTGRHVREVLGEQRYERAKPHLDLAFAGTPQPHEQIDPQPDGSVRYTQVTPVPRFRDGAVAGIYVLATDITDLRKAQETLSYKLDSLQLTEAALRESEHLLRAITDNIPATVALYDYEDRVLFANREYKLRVAKRDRDPNGAAAADYIDETIYRSSADARARARRGELVRFLAPNKQQRQIEVTYVPYRSSSGAVVGYYGIGYDVTELRESHARIRELAERLATVREDERRAVAVRLHERVAQELYAAHLNLEELERDNRYSAGVIDLARQLSQVVDQSIADVRDLTNELYPTALVHLTLMQALEQLADQFGRRAGVRVTVCQTPEFPGLSSDTRILFFRAAQEMLTNVARHARASTVRVSLEADTERVALVVEDDGKGMTDADLRKAGSLGLLGIRERFEALGGGLAVDAAAPSGTHVTVFVPAVVTETVRT
jgi:PAS domain S-box-containing protein